MKRAVLVQVEAAKAAGPELPPTPFLGSMFPGLCPLPQSSPLPQLGGRGLQKLLGFPVPFRAPASGSCLGWGWWGGGGEGEGTGFPVPGAQG